MFSGIGGLDLGLERCGGFEIAWQVENDPYCRKVLAKHWPDVPCYEDVRDVGAHNTAEADVICGGFPCQPVSVAGKRLVQDDERWLWPEFARIIRELRPRYAIMENVPGLLIRGMGDVLGDLAQLGYDAEWGIVSAASVGAPHLRKRIFIVAHTLRERQIQREHEGRPRCEEGVSEGCGVGAGAMADTEGQFSDGGDLHCGSDRSTPLQGQFGGRSPEDQSSSWWATEPSVRRVANGVPRRVDRLRSLGNAVVPQVAEYVGNRILAAR